MARTLGTTGIPCSARKAEARYSDQVAPGSSGTVSGEPHSSGRLSGSRPAPPGAPRTSGPRRPSAVSPWWMPPSTPGKPVWLATSRPNGVMSVSVLPITTIGLALRRDQLALSAGSMSMIRAGSGGTVRGRSETSDERVQAGVVVDGGERVAQQVPVDQDVAGDVDRVLGGGERRARPARSRSTVSGRELGDLDALVLGPVGDDLAGAAGRGDEPDAVAGQRSGRGQQPGRDDEVLQAVDPDDAVLPEHRVDHGVVADQRAGVRPGDPGARLAAADLDRHDRLALGEGLAGEREELSRAADRLDEQRDDPGGSSSMRYRMTSVIDTIDSLPIDTRRLTPTLRDCANVSTALASAPLCSTTPTGPREQRRRRWAGRRG